MLAKMSTSVLIRIADAAKFLSQMNHLTPLALARFLAVEIQASYELIRACFSGRFLT
jgi:hypothetical protein